MPKVKHRCQHCDNRHPVSERRSPYRWLCIKFPYMPMADDIDWSEDGKYGTWDGLDPFHTCEQVQRLHNFDCPHFELKPNLKEPDK